MMGGGGDSWTTGAVSRAFKEMCKAPVKPSPPTNQHPVFYRQIGRKTNSVKALKGKISHSMDLLTRNSPGGLPTLSLTTNSSWLPWGRVAMPLISPLMPVPHLRVQEHLQSFNKMNAIDHQSKENMRH